MNNIFRITGFAFIIVLSSCVSSKQFADVNEKLQKNIQQNEELKKANMELIAANTEFNARLTQLNKKNKELQKQIEDALYNANILKQNADVLTQRNNDLLEQLNVLNTGSSGEIEKLLNELNNTRDDLNSREDKLRLAEQELEQRNAKLIELQQVLTQKDQAVKSLKNKVMNALVGFNNKGLTVHEKNGKVYVSLDEKLLFKTGKWDVDPKGQNAIRELGKVLAQNTDITIMVEGHTDDVKMHGSGEVKDNWDLSVMRATAVTKILTQNKQIDPKRIIAAGRSEYLPVSDDKTAEGRQLNRRTEIILTPKIDELLKLIETN